MVIVLPAASINKEADDAMAKALCSWGYATLTLDERGNNGETAGPSPMDLQADTTLSPAAETRYSTSRSTTCCWATTMFRSRPDLDGNNVAVLGESMGGRFAIVATALEPGLKAAFGVSAGPYGLQGNDDTIGKVHQVHRAGRLPVEAAATEADHVPLHRRPDHTRGQWQAAL